MLGPAMAPCQPRGPANHLCPVARSTLTVRCPLDPGGRIHRLPSVGPGGRELEARGSQQALLLAGTEKGKPTMAEQPDKRPSPSRQPTPSPLQRPCSPGWVTGPPQREIAVPAVVAQPEHFTVRFFLPWGRSTQLSEPPRSLTQYTGMCTPLPRSL